MSIQKRLLALTTLLILLFSFVFASVVLPQDTPVTTSDAVLVNGDLLNDIYERVSPSVVAINVIAEASESMFPDENGVIAGSGSGFVIDDEGHIITNNHVVENATRIEVNFRDGTLARGEIVGLDPDSDLAVLKVDLPADRLHPVEFGDSSALEIGQPVVAIGSPFGQRWTLTSGIISAVDRTIQGLTNFSIGSVIQTDAPINPGNSGGPLIDLNGRVIGVNSQIVSRTGSNSGIGFAVPSNLTQKVSQALIEDGFVNYSYLGITGGDMNLALIEALELPNDTRGVVVGDVTPGGPADRAGLQSAGDEVDMDGLQVPTSVDIITAIDGVPLTGMGDLVSYLARETEPGDTVTLSVLRNGDEQVEVPVDLTPRP